MKEYLLASPIDSVIDLEDEDNAELEIKRFAVFDNSGKTLGYLECDSRIINLNQDQDKLIAQLCDLAKKLYRERDFFK